MNTKVCTKCKEEKPRAQFHKDINKKGGLGSYCKTCRNAYGKQWHKENRDSRLESKKQWYQKNRDSFLEYQKQWYQKNRERYKQRYQKNREEISRRQKQYRQENPEKIAAKRSKRRALERGGVPDVLRDCPVEKERLVQIYKLRNLLTEATGIEYHVDHIWPLSKGGPHWSGNLQIITAEENLSKSDTFCEETARVIQEALDEYCCFRYGE